MIYRNWTELNIASVTGCPLLEFANSLLISVKVLHLCSFASLTVSHSVLGCFWWAHRTCLLHLRDWKAAHWMLKSPQCLLCYNPQLWGINSWPGPLLSGPRAADRSQILQYLTDLETNPRACQSPHRNFSTLLASRKVKCHLGGCRTCSILAFS